MTATSYFDSVAKGELDPIIVVGQKYAKDQSPQKVDLSIGVYKPEDGNLNYVFPSVRLAETEIYNNDPGHPYHSMAGYPKFTKAAQQVVFGEDIPKEGRIASLQTISGTGAVHMGVEFLKRLGMKNYYVGVPTWGNYAAMIKENGCNINYFTHYNKETGKVDLDALLNTIDNMPESSVLLLQACCHNPTGADYSKDQWRQIVEKIKTKNIFTFFDIAYQGFASGDKDEDAYAIRLFYQENMEFLVCESFSKNMGLYGERIGCLHVVSNDINYVNNIQTLLIGIFRSQCSFGPLHGAKIASYVVNDFKSEWDQDVSKITTRLKSIRSKILAKLKQLNTPGNWDFICAQTGLFWYSGLSEAQVDELINKHHIYLPGNGRFNVAGFNDSNLDYVVEAIDKVVRGST